MPSGVALSSNAIDLPPGTYYIDATIPLRSGGVVGTRLFDATNNIPLLYGTTGGQGPESVIRGTFVLAGAVKIKIQHYETVTGGATGLGYAASAGTNETYLTVSIRQVAEGVKTALPATACYGSFVASNTCTSASDPQEVLFQYTGGVNKTQCSALCEEVGATCCSHVTGSNACVGTKTAVLSGGPAGSSATTCANCTKFVQGGYYLVKTAGTWDGNLGGLAGANAKCLADLKANDWQGKSSVTLNSTTVKAFFCTTPDGCNNLVANKTYSLAVSGDPSKYGLPFTTDSSGMGPNNSDNWNSIFGAALPHHYWMNRNQGTSTTWYGVPLGTTTAYNCDNFTSNNSTTYTGPQGYANATNEARWYNAQSPCNLKLPLLCAVSQEPTAGTCPSDSMDCAEASSQKKNYFVLGGSYNGNLGGLSGANEKCYNDLSSGNWLGKEGTNITRASVRAWLCDKNTCNNLLPNTEYSFAALGSATTGGAKFTTNASGAGPTLTTAWNGTTFFGSSVDIMTGREAGSTTAWGVATDGRPTTNACNNWLSSSSSDAAYSGRTSLSGISRWSGISFQCNTSKYLVCMVDNVIDQGSCIGCRDANSPSIAVGANHSCGLKEDGTAYCWGANGFGNVGDGTMSAKTTPALVVNGAGNGRFYSISAGNNFTCALKSFGGRVLCWGQNSSGATGQGTTSGNLSSPAFVVNGDSPGTFKQMSASGSGGTTVCAVGSDDAAYCWGDGSNGRLGNGATTSSSSPVKVSNGASTGKFIQVEAGGNFSCGIGMNMKLYCWGNTYGNVPSEIPLGHGPGLYKQVAVGQSHACALSIDGRAYCWGLGSAGPYGELGYNSTTSTPTPVAVANGDGPGTYKKLSVGQYNSCAIGTDDNAYCWGRGTVGGSPEGLLGNGNVSNRSIPTRVSNAGGSPLFKDIAVGYQHSCAIGNDNKSYCWGNNGSSRFGNGGSTNTNSPTVTSNGGNSGGIYRISDPSECGGLSPCEEAGGKVVGGFCWLKSGANKSCAQTCTEAGSTCNLSGTKDYAGSGGSSANCQSVLDALGKTGSGSVTDGTSYFGLSCNWDSSGDRNRVTSPATSCSAYAPNTYQACACDLGIAPLTMTPGYFVISDNVRNGDFRGIAAANSLCLSDLKSKQWKGKGSATLNSSTVKAFLCTDQSVDPSVCNNLKPNKQYSFSGMGSTTIGGATFMSDATGAGPNNVDDWSGATYFDTTLNYWTGRLTVSDSKWQFNGGHSHTCVDWTSSNFINSGSLGSADDDDEFRWERMSATCNNTNRYICMVHPGDPSSTNDCTYAGGYEVGGACWFLGDSNQSCTTVCTGIGGTYNSATESYGGSGGLNTNCTAIMDAFGAGGNNTTTAGNAGGCYISEANANRYRGTSTTTASYSAANLHRACACNPPDSSAQRACAQSGGVEVGGACWFLAADNQGCGDMCTEVGGTYNASGPTQSYAGSGGSNANCGTVLTALGAAGSGNSANFSNTMGCHVNGSTRRRGTTLTAASASGAGIRRACSCEMGGSSGPSTMHLVMTDGTWNGNLGGRAGANAKCLADLQANDWMGKNTAVLSSSNVKALLCDETECTNLMPNKTYAFASSGSQAIGGATFTTDASSGGPNNSANWGGTSIFGGAGTYWMNRSDADATAWSNDAFDEACNYWSSSSSTASGEIGSSAYADRRRWNYDEIQCNTLRKLLCMVNDNSEAGGGSFNCASAGGVNVSGQCWIYGAAGQSCTTVCSSKGGTCDLTQTQSVGSAGVNSDCRDILTSLSAPGSTASAYSSSYAVGCVYDTSDTNRIRHNGETTTCAGSASNMRRACACD